MVLAVTIFCVWLGIAANRANRQKHAVEVLKKAGAELYYDFQVDDDGVLKLKTPPPPPGPDWLRNLIGIDYFATVVRVYVGPETNVTDETFAALADLPQLRNLALVNKGVTNSRMARLGNLAGLHMLTITTSSLSDSGWGFLEKLRELKSLRLDRSNASDSALSHIKEMPQLTKLYLIDNQVTDSGLTHLEGLGRLEFLWFYGHKVPNRQLQFRVRGTPTPKTLGSGTTGITDDAVQHFKKLPRLKVLKTDIAGTRITPRGLEELKTAVLNVDAVGQQ
jgi:hypothetical protein